MTYALGADKRTLLRAGYNRYVSQLGSAVSGANPLAYSAFYFYGFDTNGDHIIQRNELLKFRSLLAGVDAANPGSVALDPPRRLRHEGAALRTSSSSAPSAS